MIFIIYNNSLKTVKTYVNEEDGKLHFVDATGADSVLPFSSGAFEVLEEGFIPLTTVPKGSSVNIDVNFKNTYTETPAIIAFLSEHSHCSYETAPLGNSSFRFRLQNKLTTYPRSSSVRWYAVTGDVCNKIFSDS